jgi:ABC-2 type transport system permease protein
MIASIRRKASIYGAIAAMAPKFFLAYTIWVWMELLVQIITMVIFVAFWRAIYAETSTIAGLDLQQTLSYILLARIFGPLTHTMGVGYFGRLLRDGQIEIELLRPVDFQGQNYAMRMADLLTALILQLPLLLIAVAFFGLRLPSDPLVWGVFLLAAVLGASVVFCFDWALGCLSFYTTEVWGLIVVRYTLGMFFSGTFLPIVMMPEWLQTVVNSVPIAQALYVPVALLSGITPLSEAPRALLIQLAWLVGLLALSRWVFSVSVRKVTVQGG